MYSIKNCIVPFASWQGVDELGEQVWIDAIFGTLAKVGLECWNGFMDHCSVGRRTSADDIPL